MDEPIIFLKQQENYFIFSVYSENLDLVIVNEWSELGRLVTLDALTTLSQELIEKIWVKFATNPSIRPRKKWICMYTGSTAFRSVPHSPLHLTQSVPGATNKL